jgi:hypothetical protein
MTTEKQLIAKLKELVNLYQQGISVTTWPGIPLAIGKVTELMNEISALESQSEPDKDERKERKTSNTGRGHGNNFCSENCD